MPRTGTRLLAAALIGSLLTLASTPPASTSTSPVTKAPAPTLRWYDCHGGFECATLAVPVDYAEPNSEQVEIAVIRRPATDPGDGPRRSLVLNYGGPGDPGTETLRLAAETVPDAVRARFDLVSFDPRGTGSSRPIDCVDDATFERAWSEDVTASNQTELRHNYDGDTASVDLVAECVARQGSWLTHVGTRNVARDLDRLRVALGETRLTYLGYSYGTVLGAVYAQEFPARVRALVLDSAVNLSEDAATQQLGNATGFERALDAFLADCADNSDCPFHEHGDPRAALMELRDRFESGWTIRTADGRSVGVTEFYAGLLAALYSRASWTILADALDRAANDRDGTYLRLLNDAFAGRRDDGTYNNVQEAIGFIVCADQPEPRASFEAFQATYDALTARFPFFGPVIASSPTGCDPRIPPPAPADTLGDVRTSDAPSVLIIGTTGDPATPYEGAQDLQRRLRGARVLTVEDTQHGGYAQGNPCVDDYVDDYLLRRRLPPRGARCSR